MWRIIPVLQAFILTAPAEPLKVRVVAANLTSGNSQTYSPDNANHSNPEGAGARILSALRPDIVLIQEWNTSIPVRQWVSSVLGREFSFFREEGPGIPNGIISRFPIIEAGEWDDPALTNRDFAWAKIGLPGGLKVWVVSIHLYAKKSQVRAAQAADVVRLLRERVAPGERIIIGGDFNTREESEEALRVFSGLVVVPGNPPADDSGNTNTNAGRNRPYDWVLADPKTTEEAVAVVAGGRTYPGGLVFDTRVFPALPAVPPARAVDSAAPQMQHMAVVRDFEFP